MMRMRFPVPSASPDDADSGSAAGLVPSPRGPAAVVSDVAAVVMPPVRPPGSAPAAPGTLPAAPPAAAPDALPTLSGSAPGAVAPGGPGVAETWPGVKAR